MSDWDKRIQKAEKYLEQTHEKGDKIYQRYQDEREESSSLAQRANFFYSNTNTLKESLFNSMPKPDVSRVQRGDFEDDVSRVAASVVQRGLTYEIECAEDFEEAITSAVLDRLVPGIGQVWITFDVDKDEDDEPIQGSESIKVDAVYWKDFLYGPARRWSKVPWVARRLHLTKKEMQEAYGDEITDKIGAADNDKDEMTPDEINKDKFCVYEIWDKKTKKVFHIYKGLEEPLKEEDDPYKLRKFFPCPRPLIANPSTAAFKPRSDYSIAQDQYNQLDVLYGRIQLIVEAIKVVGLYDSGNTNIARMLQGSENKLIPVDNWAMHAERGGTRGQIDWYPVEQIATVLQSLYAAFEATKAILFEITGMSDIMRGASNPYETKGAQEIKAQFASVRMGGYQRDVSKFVRDVLRIMAEMFTQLYSDEKIMTIIGQLPPNDMEYLTQAAQVLRSDVLSKYKVNIQTNSLTQADWALEKEQRMELVTTIGQMIGQTTELAKGEPKLAMLGVQLIKFAIAGYKAGTELEGWIDKQLDEMARAAMEAEQNPEPPEPTEEEKAMQAEQQKMQAEMQMKQAEMQMKMQMEQAKLQIDQQKSQMELQMREKEAAIEIQMKEAELVHAQRMAEMDLRIKQIELRVKMQTSEHDLQVKQESANMDLENKKRANEQKLQQDANKPKKDDKK